MANRREKDPFNADIDKVRALAEVDKVIRETIDTLCDQTPQNR